MTTMPGTGWTSYMLAVSRTDATDEYDRYQDNIAILDILTSIYANDNNDNSVIKYITAPNALDMTATGK